MFNKLKAALVGCFVLSVPMPVLAQAPSPKPPTDKPTAPGLIKLTGDDEKRAKQLDEQIDNALKADRWDEAIARAEELLALRTRIQGPKHFETVDAEWRLKTLRRVAPMPREDRVTCQSTLSMNEQALTLSDQGKYAQAQPLFEKVLEIDRRLLTDEHPDTASDYNSLAENLTQQGKYADALPLVEKALEINRRLLTDDHPSTARSYSDVARNLGHQGKFAQAQPLFEKALEIRRRLLTDNHPGTATEYNNVANVLGRQGKYAQAQPLLEKALEIKRRLLTDNHPDTAEGYNNVANNLSFQSKHALAQPLLEKALEICRRLLTDNHPRTATAYNSLAYNLHAQGKHAQAQPLYEKALEIRRAMLTEVHPGTASSYYNLPADLHAQGKYVEAKDQLLRAVMSLDAARLRIAFTGLERAAAEQSVRPALAALLARLGQPAEAQQALEEDLGRGLLDELAARQDRRLAPAERARLRELTTELERLDKLVEANPKGLDQAERAKRFAELRRDRELASIALGELQTKVVQEYGPLAGQVASLSEIQAALPADAALIAWVDIAPVGPNAADVDGEHWGMVVRSKGIPAWVPIAGTGPSACGPRTTPGWQAKSGPSCEPGPAMPRRTCDRWSRNCALSASSRWPRPSAQPPMACRRPVDSSSCRLAPWQASRSRCCSPPTTPGR